VTQQLLMYKLSGLPLHVPQEWVGMFAKGTKPERDLTADEVSAIDAALFSTYEQLVEDSKQGLFTDFMPYTTSTNMELNDIGTAQTFVFISRRSSHWFGIGLGQVSLGFLVWL